MVTVVPKYSNWRQHGSGAGPDRPGARRSERAGRRSRRLGTTTCWTCARRRWRVPRRTPTSGSQCARHPVDQGLSSEGFLQWSRERGGGVPAAAGFHRTADALSWGTRSGMRQVLSRAECGCRRSAGWGGTDRRARAPGRGLRASCAGCRGQAAVGVADEAGGTVADRVPVDRVVEESLFGKPAGDDRPEEPCGGGQPGAK